MNSVVAVLLRVDVPRLMLTTLFMVRFSPGGLDDPLSHLELSLWGYRAAPGNKPSQKC